MKLSIKQWFFELVIDVPEEPPQGDDTPAFDGLDPGEIEARAREALRQIKPDAVTLN